jgi:ribosomal protein L30
MSFYRITLKRSTIGLPQKYKTTVQRLGLKRTGSVVYQKVSADSAGQVLRIKELVDVEIVDRALSKRVERENRKSDPGFTVLGQ